VFCPKCKDEFRAGFTHCAGCNVDLVDEFPTKSFQPSTASSSASTTVCAAMVDYCGFLGLEEAREARDSLRLEGIRSEIVIRESPESAIDRPIKEEYWLRVDHGRYRECSAVLGFDHVEADEESGFNCSSCGQLVTAEESFCPKCGARFEDD
jgi:hypothetical protein